MNDLLVPVILALVIGSAFVMYFAMEMPCSYAIWSIPDMKMLVHKQQYLANGGSVSGRCILADGYYNVPKDSVSMARGTEIGLVVSQYSQPNSILVYADRVGDNSTTDMDIVQQSNTRYLVDMPEGDYGIKVIAEWDDKSLPVYEASYYFRINVVR